MDGVRRYQTEEFGNVGRYVDPAREHKQDNALAAARKDAFDSLLNLILTHKKEIVKVPATSSYASAQEWARKHKGYRVEEKDIGGGPEKEVVIYDRSGYPAIVNGYKLGASDWGVRSAYYKEHPTAEHRAGYSMKDWGQDKFWKVKKNDENPWMNDSVHPTKLAYKIKEAGFRIPTKPKMKQSVYSIFSKLISPFVKTFFDTQEFTRISGGAGNSLGANSGKFLKKVVSPITIYRYLYMKIVERNYFFQQLNEGHLKSRSYQAFKQYVKLYPNRFFTWFCREFLDASMQNFKGSRVTQAIVGRNLVDGQLHVDGSDVNDGFSFLVGLDNWNDQTPSFRVGSNVYTFFQILADDAVSGAFLATLEDKNDRKAMRVARQALEKFKKRAQKGAKTFFDERMKSAFFTDEKAEAIWRAGAEYGCFTLTSEEAAQEHEASGAPKSPPKKTAIVPENVKKDLGIPKEEEDILDDEEDEEESAEMVDAKKPRPGDDE